MYNKISSSNIAGNTIEEYHSSFFSGEFTAQEAELWQFVLSFYGSEPFSTIQLEKDFGNSAYATIRGFVLNFQN